MNKTNNKNFYLEDSTLKRIVNRFIENLTDIEKRDIEDHIIQYGELVGGIINTLTERSHKEGKYGEAAGTAGLIASGFLPGPLQAILMGLYPTELGKGTLDEYYNERVPGSVLPARLKPENMK